MACVYTQQLQKMRQDTDPQVCRSGYPLVSSSLPENPTFFRAAKANVQRKFPSEAPPTHVGQNYNMIVSACNADSAGFVQPSCPSAYRTFGT